MQRSALLIATLVFAASCGGKEKPPEKKDAAVVVPQVAPITQPPSGVDAVKRMGFVYGDGWTAYDKAVAAKGKSDLAGARTQLDASLAKDPDHLDAHYLYAKLLAGAGEHAAAVDHLVVVLAADYFRYGPMLAADIDMKEFLGTSHGQAVTALAQKIQADYKKRVASGVLLVARRSAFKWPKDLGAQGATTRGELYAYDRETKRYLRLSHTDHKVAGFIRAPGGGEVALLGFDKIDRPKGETKGEMKPDTPATFVTSWVLILETVDWTVVGKKVSLGAARELAVGYGAGDQLLVSTAQADGRWGTKDAVVSTVDKSAGKATKVSTPPPTPRIVLTLDEGKMIRDATGIQAVWSGDPPTTPNFKTAAGTTIEVPESHAARQASFAVAPTSGRVVFATAVDPCAKDVAPSLYVSDGKSAALKHLLTAKSRFANRWLDPNTLAYEDGEGAIRIWDATTGREAAKLENKAGIALDVLSLAPAPLCKGSPPVVEPGPDVGSGAGSAAPPDEPPLPPEEPTGSPVTTPQ
jgi:hypothetical protein